MKMGIERVLKEKFGNAVKDIRQVYDEEAGETTVEVSYTNKIYVKVVINERTISHGLGEHKAI